MIDDREFTPGDVDEPANGADHWVAGINHYGSKDNPYKVWLSRIETYGATKEDAEAMRDRILAALDLPFTLEDIKMLEDLVSLGGTYAEDAVVQGMRSYHPFMPDKMRELASGGYGRAFEILKQLKIMQGERDGS